MDWSNPTIYNAVSYDFEELIRRAKAGSIRPSTNRGASTASGFADWVFSLSHPGRKNTPKDIGETFDLARRREREIASLMIGLNGLAFDAGKRIKASEWELVYVDPLTENQPTISFEASRLTLNGIPIRCRPDVVLRNRASGELMIVERKIAVTASVVLHN